MIPLIHGIHHLIHGLPPEVQEWANTLRSNAKRYKHRAGASYLRLLVRFWGPITIIIYGGTIRFIIEQWLRIGEYKNTTIENLERGKLIDILKKLKDK